MKQVPEKQQRLAHQHHHTTSENIKLSFLLNVVFTILEIVGGLLINSVAILSDALHDLGDSFSLGLAWFLSNYAEKESDEKYSYGYRRFSLLGALINTIVLVVGSLFILSEAVPRLLNPESFDVSGMIIFAVFGIAINGFATLRLRGESSANARVISWHLLEDVLGWAAVLLVGITSLFVDWPILDPLLSILITLFIFYNVLRRLGETVDLFLQAVPADMDLDEIKERLLTVENVQSLHHLHIWSLDGEHHVLTAHIGVDVDANRQLASEIKKVCRQKLADYELTHVTLEVEFGSEDCSMNEDIHNNSTMAASP